MLILRLESYMKSALAVVVLLLSLVLAPAQEFKPNYDEDKVPKYTLPDPLVMADGAKVTTADDWKDKLHYVDYLVAAVIVAAAAWLLIRYLRRRRETPAPGEGS